MSVRLTSLAAIILPAVLAGCSATLGAGTGKPLLPDLPAKAVSSCGKPVAKVGDDLGVLAARYNAARSCEAGKRGALIVFYRDLRKGFAGAR